MTTKQILDRPHTLNLSIPQALRAAIQEAREVTGETVVGFIRAAIVDRIAMVGALPRAPRRDRSATKSSVDTTQGE